MPARGSLAQVDYEFGTLQAYINVDLELNVGEESGEIEDTVVHELVHIMLAPIHKGGEDQMLEYTAVSITRVLLALDKRTLAEVGEDAKPD